MRLLSDYYSDDEDLSSHIYLDDDVYVVEFRKNNRPLATRRFPDNNIHYVEDAADNYVRGILKIKPSA